jgi:uncharacterized protein
MDRRWLLLVPSVVLAFVTVPLWLLWPPPPREPVAAWPILVAIGLAVAAGLLAGGWVLERLSPSFASVSRRLEHLLLRLRLPVWASVVAAALTGVVEEVFFRGWLLPVVGVWGQAAVFMLLHPAGRRGWAYTAYTGVAGLAFGLVTIATGSLTSAVVAHVAVNLHGFVTGSRADASGGVAPAPRDERG